MTNINSLSWNETQILSCKSFLQMFGKNEKDIKTNYRKLLKNGIQIIATAIPKMYLFILHRYLNLVIML
jgi:hypothetical protein